MATDEPSKEKNNNIDDQSKSESDKMSEKETYFNALRLWHRNYMQHEFASNAFPYYLIANYPQLFANHPTSTHHNLFPQVNNLQQRPRPGRLFNYFDSTRQARQDEIIALNGGYEYTIAPLWKRFLAEMIDVFILFLIKIMITFALVDIFDLNLNIDWDLTNLRSSLEDDYTEILNFTTELLVLEIVTKLAVCIYEALWTAQARPNALGGATPGKMLLGIRILYVEAVQVIDPMRQPGLNNNQPLKALLWPAQNLGIERALFRSVFKNLFITFLFPICFFAFLYRNNRTIYEQLTKTIVVEETPPPPLRRR
ncbi:protein FAM8A1 [Culicoides brevitarsis]|uniref:protein FAM8A1 n=1 Tax=Culicoides brevitarsis TaxID=469753 RepID=UPI00307BE0FA